MRLISIGLVLGGLMLILTGCTASQRSGNAPATNGPSIMACEHSLESGAVSRTASRSACEGLFCFHNSRLDAKCFTTADRCIDGYNRSQRRGDDGTGCMDMSF